MTRDPLEGIDADGMIVTGTSRRRVPRAYEQCLAACISQIREIEDDEGSVFVYGSVATGQATAPDSDVDLLYVSADPPTDALSGASLQLTSKFRDLAREVAIVSCPRSVLDVDSVDGRAMRCFVRHYCVCIAGADLSAPLPPCKATPELAWSFNHDVVDRIQRWRDAAAGSDRLIACQSMARGMLLASTSIASITAATWTTDRATAARIVAEAYPQHATATQQLVRWITEPTDDRNEIDAMIDSYGAWLVETMETLRSPEERAAP